MNDDYDGPILHCLVCGGDVGYIECPTGGWWAHDSHPLDDHDAEVQPSGPWVGRNPLGAAVPLPSV